MNSLDIIIGLFLLFGLIQGFKNGFLIELASLVGLVLGVFCAIYFSHFASDILIRYTEWEEKTANLVAFAITFIVVVILVSIIAKALTKIASFAALGLLNKLAGGIFGLLKMAFFVSVILLFTNSFQNEISFLSEEKKETSVLYKPVSSLAPMVLPKLIKELNEYVNDDER